MSSPIMINRPATPSESSRSVSSSVASTSSTGSAHPLIYTRDELLALATSPLSHGPAPAAIAAFPEIKRRTRRGVVEAYQALDYARSSTQSRGNASASTPKPKPQAEVARSGSPHAQHAEFPLQMPPPVWKVDVYVPPARRVEQEQRVRPGRDVRVLRTWRRPVQTRW